MTKDLYLILIYVIVINLITLIMFYVDKQEHKRHRHAHGISSHTFLTLAILGGSVGEILGMLFFRHKRHHKEFTILLPIILVAQIVIAVIVLRMYFSTEVSPVGLIPA
ncbi:MAG: DUF1294 domain-containing protein [Paludibacteraceae bacterium]|nr:DUF1294 domain-containing protein [Paludibacteraceae bacterium]